jgi:NhaP-type Na+/H+ or K+/H+ antiporter
MPEIMLTIVSAYMTYLVGDRLLGVSGVLAVVALGLWMSAFGVNYVSRKVEAALEVVWDVLEYCANTLIFVLR